MATNNDFKVKNGLVVSTTATLLSNATSTNTSTGALIVAGGVGIGQNLNVGGNISLPNATSIALGLGTTPGSNTVSIGNQAGQTTQGSRAVAIGISAGQTTQGSNTVAVGQQAGSTTQGGSAVAVGSNAGATTQGSQAVAIGPFAGASTQGSNTVAVGNAAGQTSQGAQAVAIGQQAGNSSQGVNSIAIGNLAGQTNQVTGSIIISAIGVAVNAANTGTYIAPVRSDATFSATVFAVYYNPLTKELTTSTITPGPSTTSITATNAANLLGGTATQVPFQTATNTTVFSSDFTYDDVNKTLAVGTSTAAYPVMLGGQSDSIWQPPSVSGGGSLILRSEVGNHIRMYTNSNTGTTRAGSVFLQPGSSGSGQGGHVEFQPGASTSGIGGSVNVIGSMGFLWMSDFANGGTFTIDFSSVSGAYHDLTVALPTVITLTGAVNRQSGAQMWAEYTIRVTNTSGIESPLTWPASITWQTGVAPKLSTVGYTTIKLMSYDAGTTYDGSVVGNSTVTDDTGTNVTYYPMFSAATTGSTAVKVNSSKLTYNPFTGVLNATSFVGTFIGAVSNATTTTNIAGGSAGAIAYQTASGLTGFIGTGTTGQILRMGANTATFVSTTTLLVGTAVSAVSATTATSAAVAYSLASTSTTQVGYANTATSAAVAYSLASTSTTQVGFANTATSAAIAYSLVGSASLQVASATTATNIAGGTAGVIHYQISPGITGFIGTGTTGTLLQMGANTATFVSTTTLLVGTAVNAVSATTATSAAVAYSLASTSTTQVGFANTATSAAVAYSLVGSASLQVASATTATNIAGGTAGVIHYQISPGITGFIGTGTTGTLLQMGANTATFVSTSTIQVGYANTSTSAAVAYSLASTSTTQVGFANTATSAAVAYSLVGSSTLQVASATTATNIAGGTAGVIHYQISPGITGFIGTGTTGQVLAMGANTATFVSTSTLQVGYANTATSAAVAYSLASTSTTQVGFANTATSAAVAYSLVGSASLQVASATTATNIAGGTAGVIHYQISPGITGFIGTGTTGTLLQMGANTATFVSTTTLLVGTAVNAVSATTATSAATAYSLASTSTTQVGFANTATSAAVAYSLASTSTTQVGYANTATNAFTATSAAIAYSLVGSAALQVASATTATNIAGGTAGVIHYQISPGITGFIGTGTTGQLLAMGANTATFVSTTTLLVGTAVSAVNATTATSAATAYSWVGGTVVNPVTFSGPVTFNGTATYVLSTNTIYTDNLLDLHTPPSGTWAVDDGKDIGLMFHYFNGADQNGALVLANNTKYLEWYNTGAENTSGVFTGTTTYGTFKTGVILAASTASTNSTNTGALQVAGGVGIAGGLFVGGTVTATSFVGAFAGTINGTATTATNIAGGTFGAIAYQTASGLTGFIGTGTTGQLLAMGANTATFVSTTTLLVGTAVSATTATSAATAYALASTSTTQVGYATTATYAFTATSAAVAYSLVGSSTLQVASATTATNIAGGTAGVIHYQISPGITGFIGTGTTGQILRMGANTATFVSTTTLLVGTAVSAVSATTATSAAVAYSLASTSTTQVGYANTATSAAMAYSLASTSTTQVGYATTATYAFTATSAAVAYSLLGSASLQVASATTATNIAGGTAGVIHYQISPGITGFIGTGTTGQVLAMGANTATFVSTTTLLVGTAVNAVSATTATSAATAYALASTSTTQVGYATTATNAFTATSAAVAYSLVGSSTLQVASATTATNIAGGTFGAIAYQTASGLTGFIGTGTTGQLLAMGANTATFVSTSTLQVGFANTATSAAVAYSLASTSTTQVGFANTATSAAVAYSLLGSASLQVASATTATNIAGGTAGVIHYQISPGITGFIGTGTTGTLLQMGANTATFVSTSTLQVGYANTATSAAVAYSLASTSTTQVGFANTATSAAVAYSLLGSASLQVASATTATNIAGGSAGAIAYQTASGLTGFIGTGTTGQVLTMGANTATFVSTTTLLVGTAVSAVSATTATSAATAYALASTSTTQVGYATTATNAFTATSAAVAYSLVGSSTLQVASATTATNIAGGTAGVIHYQISPGITGFIGTGTTGSILQMGANTATFVSTTTLQVGYAVNATTATSAAVAYALASTSTTQVGFANTATSAAVAYSLVGSSALQVSSATTSTNIANGTAGALPYQISPGVTGFIGTGTTGQVLVMGATTATWQNAAGTIGNATTATNIAGGTFGAIAYQTASGLTGFIGTGTTGQVLTMGANTATWQNSAGTIANAVTATNIAGGLSGAIPIQTAAGITSFIATGTSGTLLQMGTNSASFVSTTTLLVGTAVSAVSATTATSAATAYSLASTSTTQVGFANTATSAAVAYSLASTSTTQVGYANTATSAAVAYSLASTSTTQVGYAITATNASALVTAAVNTNASFYPSFVSANNAAPGTSMAHYTTSSFAVNPSTGVVTLSNNIPSLTSGALRLTGANLIGQHAAGILQVGTSLNYTMADIMASFARNTTTSISVAMQNQSSSATASTDLIILNDDVLFNGGAGRGLDIGINSSLYVPTLGTDPFGKPSGGYVAAFGASMTVGTMGTNATQFGTTATLYLVTSSTIRMSFDGSGGVLLAARTTVTNTTSVSSTNTGALQVAGGVGIAGGMFVGGTITATTFVGTFAGSISTATNIAGGTAGAIAYQTASGLTGFIGTGTVGQVLAMGANTATFVSTTTLLVGTAVSAVSATTATSAATAYSLASTSTTQVGFANTATSAAVAYSLASTSTTQVGFANTATSAAVAYSLVGSASLQVASATTATNIAGGTAGVIPYQTALGVTGFIGTGTTGQVLTMGANTATWQNSSAAFTGGTVANTTTFLSTVTIASTAPTISTNTGALQVAGGVGIGGGLYVGGIVTATQLQQTSQQVQIGAGAKSAAQGVAIGNSVNANFGYAIGIGYNAGLNGIGQGAVAIGSFAGGAAQVPANAVIISGQNGNLAAYNAGFYVAPVRADATSSATAFAVYYNPDSKELTTSTGGSSNATNLTGGTAGVIPYQSASGVTGFIGTGTTGQVLTMGANTATWQNSSAAFTGGTVANTTTFLSTVTIASTVASISTTTGALQVAGGVGVAGDSWFGGRISIQTNPFTANPLVITDSGGGGNIYISGGTLALSGGATNPGGTSPGITMANVSALTLSGGNGGVSISGGNNSTLIVTSTSATISTGTGALIVNGGVGVAGNMIVGGTITAGAFAGSISTATNIAGGTAGALHYQISPGVTGFIGTGTTGQVLSMGANTASWITLSSSFNGGTISNPLVINNATQATSTTTGALQIVNGGAGIGGNVYVGGTFNTLNSATLSLPAGNQVVVNAAVAPTNDLQVITNVGFPVVTAGASALQVDYYGGAAAIEASSLRVNITPGSTSGGTWNSTRIVAAGAAAAGVTLNGTKYDSKATGAGVSNGIYFGTGWDNILSYTGTTVISGTGQVFSGGFAVSTGTVVNDIASITTFYPTFISTSTGASMTLTVSTSNLSFVPSTGVLSALIFTSLSDRTQKTNIQPVTNATSVVVQLQGVSFDYLHSGKSSYGVIAQDIEKVLPEVVHTNEQGIKSVDYQALSAFLIESIKELNKRISELENKQK